ncbi:class I SAM-dependent methyltransferase [Microbispora rosea]
MRQADSDPYWNTNVARHPGILRAVPEGCGDALDVGCGDGLLARKLTGRAKRVTGVDRSLAMIARARSDVVVHDQTHQAVALDADRPVALLLDELPEEHVAHVEQEVFAMGGLAQGEQPWPAREQPHDGGGLHGLDGVRDADIHTFNGIVEPSGGDLSGRPPGSHGETLN